MIIEALNYISTRIGGLTFADSDGEFSTAQIFAYRYLPQMIIVLYGVGWAAVDLDVKRLEPYFQLSKPGGASASDSILLHYPFDFLALVPIDAAKKKFVTPASKFVTHRRAYRTQALERFCSGNGIGFDHLGHHATTKFPSDHRTGYRSNSYTICTHWGT